MKQPSQQFDLVWFGSAPRALGWLKTRIAERIRVRSGALPSGELHELVSQGAARIVVACQDRLSYPGELLSQLAERHAEIPIVLAVDNWWDGSGRTGLRRTSHVVLPWYRWWDAWVGWLDGTASHLFNPCPSPYAHSRLSRAAQAQPASTPWSAGAGAWVVANCKATARAWVALVQQCGLHAVSLSQREFQSPSKSGHTPTPAPDFILLDDSSLDTMPTCGDSEQLIRLVQTAANRFPDAIICIAVTMPRWETWSHSLASGAHEIIVKPNHGQAIERIIVDRLAGIS